jgi:hypothetical protein
MTSVEVAAVAVAAIRSRINIGVRMHGAVRASPGGAVGAESSGTKVDIFMVLY